MNKQNTYPYKLGLALSGGGARGFAHIGVLRALEERNIYPDIISGTSVGALIAIFYADGYSVDEIEEIAATISFTSIAGGIIPRSGLFRNSGIGNLLAKHIRAKTFEELKIPVKVVASDIEIGKIKTFHSGEIIPAVMASCSVPIVFSPVSIDGHHYVDGGLLMNFPVSVIRQECKKIIGVDISPVISIKYTESLKYIVERSMNYMVGANSNHERQLCDYLIESDEISVYSLFDFKHGIEIYQKGYEQATKYLDENKERLHTDFFAQKPKKMRDKFADFLLSLKKSKNKR